VSSGCQAGLEMRARLEDRHAQPNMRSRIAWRGGRNRHARGALDRSLCSVERNCLAAFTSVHAYAVTHTLDTSTCVCSAFEWRLRCSTLISALKGADCFFHVCQSSAVGQTHGMVGCCSTMRVARTSQCAVGRDTEY
jgi:hypothetical protein